MADATEQKQPGPGRRFEKGRSGNPAGRPRGVRNRATRSRAAEALLEGEAEALTRKAIELALGGDAAVLRLCLERLVAPRRGRTMRLPLPRVRKSAHVADMMTAITAALADGAITPGEATELGRLAAIFLRVIQTGGSDWLLKLVEEDPTVLL
jgi:hypothetical protein